MVAERQGQVAARNILGRSEQFDAVPFFWSQHYDVAINYLGHTERWDAVEIDGNLDARNSAVCPTSRVIARSMWRLSRETCKACKPKQPWSPRLCGSSEVNHAGYKR